MATVIKNFTIREGGSFDFITGTIEVEDNLLFDYQKYCTISAIKTLLSRSTISPRFRISLCNPDGTFKEQIPNEDIVMGGSYSENYQNGQRRSLSFSLINDDGKYTPSINSIWVNSRIMFEIGLEVPEITGILWFKKGIYIINSASPSRSATSKTVSVECSDKYARLEGKEGTLTNTFEIPSGSVIEDVIEDILHTSCGDGYVLDDTPFVYHSSFKGKTTPLTVSESEGSNYGSLIAQLAEILSAEYFYDSNGRLNFVPITEVTSDGDKPVIFDFVDVNGDFQDNNFSFSFNDFVNKVIVIGANINGHTVMAESVNDDPSSPLSYQKIGYRVANPINDSNITNDMLAQERADYELRQVLIAKSSQSSNVFFNPLLTVNNLVTYTDNFFELKRERLLLQSVSLSIDYSGTMSITASNIKNLPFVL